MHICPEHIKEYERANKVIACATARTSLLLGAFPVSFIIPLRRWRETSPIRLSPGIRIFSEVVYVMY